METKHHGAVRFPFNICLHHTGDFLQVPLHWHDSMELVYVKKAAESCRSVNNLPEKQGDIYIFALAPHALHQRGQAVMEYENIIFELELLGGADDLCAERYLLPLQSGRMALRPRASSPARRATPGGGLPAEAEEATKVKTPGMSWPSKGRCCGFCPS